MTLLTPSGSTNYELKLQGAEKNSQTNTVRQSDADTVQVLLSIDGIDHVVQKLV